MESIKNPMTRTGPHADKRPREAAVAEAVQSFLDDRLRSEGWAPLSAAGSPMTVYANGPKLCIALVDHDVNTSQTRITVLLKRRGIK